MSYDDDLIRRTADKELPQCYQAVIHNTPSALDDDLYVTIPGVDDGQNKWGPCLWSPRVGTGGTVVMPQKGDLAVVVLDDTKQHWVLGFSPYA